MHGGIMSDNDMSTRNPDPLSAKVLECATMIEQLVARAKQPGYCRDDWAPLAEMFDVDEFERIGIYRERMTWDDYLDFMVPWAQWKDFDTCLPNYRGRIPGLLRSRRASHQKTPTSPS
jgi:hypothetical protein